MKRVMFVCKKNSARSQMAEGFPKTIGKGKIEVISSGLYQLFMKMRQIIFYKSS